MDQSEERRGSVPKDSEEFGNVPKNAESFGSARKDAEAFGKVPNHSEGFGTLRNDTVRTEQHTLTVRESARLFEQAGVPRTERSIVNWCQPNHQSVARLDAFFDTNERKYFITPQSVEFAIREEQAKQAAAGQTIPPHEAPERVRKASEEDPAPAEDREEIGLLRTKLRDLEITNRVKDQVIGMMEKERDRLIDERENHVHELMSQSYRIGQLETEVKQLGAPNDSKTPGETTI